MVALSQLGCTFVIEGLDEVVLHDDVLVNVEDAGVALAWVYTFVYTAIVDFEWDPRKNRANIRKHGIDFRDAIQTFERPYLEGVDERFDYGEERMIAYGQMRAHIVAVVFVMRGGRRRIVSARKATKAETKAYLEAVYGKGHEKREN